MNKPHKKLNAWTDAVDLAQQIYRVTERFPSNEQFGLTSQIRRAAVSIPSNIAEGAARQTRKEFIQFLHVSKGSLVSWTLSWNSPSGLSTLDRQSGRR